MPVRLTAAGLLAALVGASAAAAHRLWRAPLPRTRGQLQVEGLEASLKIRRDRWGMPHVEASTDGDLSFGEGFCHGQDRLFQLDVYRRVMAGRLAEVAGPAGLDSDRFFRTLGLRRLAELEAVALPEPLRARLEAYCAGVNAAAACARALPLEFQLQRARWEPWQPADTLVFGKALSLGFSTNWEHELMRADLIRLLGPEKAARLCPPYPEGNPVALTPGSGFAGSGAELAGQLEALRGRLPALLGGGSNNWAVSGGRSATGAPLLAADPHLTSSMPGLWYAIALQQGERFARGIGVPGAPGISMGQSNDCAWSFTNAAADTMDLFVEQIDGGSYLFEGEWRELRSRNEEIVVRGRDEPEVIEVRETHHGPIVTDVLADPGPEPLALAWTALRMAARPLDLMHAGSGAELVEALRDYTMPVMNLVWADRHGSIGFALVGKLPRRRSAVTDVPKPGWTGEHEWEGEVPFDEMPRVADPAAGFVVTANNRTVPDGHPVHVTSEWFDGYRAQRIEQLLGAQQKHDLDGFGQMQLDLHSIPGLETVRRLLEQVEPQSPREHEVFALLKEWDGHLGPESIAGAVYQAFTLALAREVARAAIGDSALARRWLDESRSAFLDHVTAPWRWQSHLLALWAEGDESLIGGPWPATVARALREAIAELERGFGPDPSGWRWGELHPLRFPHPFDGAVPVLGGRLSRELRVGGGQETVCQIAYDPNSPYKALWAPSARLLIDLASPERSRWQLFTGNSGHPGSKHYDDLMERWQAGQSQPLAGEGPWEELALRPA